MADIRAITIGDLLDERADEHPDRPYFHHHSRDVSLSYGQFRDIVNTAAKGLLSLNLGRGDHVAVWAGNVPEWVITQFATAKVGAVMVTVNPAYQLAELEYLLGQSHAKAIVMAPDFRGTDYVAMLRKAIPRVDVDSPGAVSDDNYPRFREAILVEGDEGGAFRTWGDLLAAGESVSDQDLAAAQALCEPTDVINIQYTSGTTGFPKGAMLTHGALLGDADLCGSAQNLTADDVICAPVPFYHCFGCVLAVLTSLTKGCSFVTPHDFFEPSSTLAAVDRFDATSLYGVPTMFIAELADPDFDNHDMSTLRTGIMAGSPCPMEVMREVVDRMGAKEVTIAYGQTEASPVITQTTPADSIEIRVTTVGKALPGIEVKIVDPETGVECPIGKQGELCARGFIVMDGYYDKPAETARAIDAEGWLHTGDLATVDNDGYYKITGRLKDMVIRGGENIYPREVEEFLFTHAAIQDVQVFGVADEKYGEQLAAWVQLKEGESLNEDEVKDFCRGKIAHFKIPHYVRFVSEYPMTVTGKIQKFKMSETMAEELRRL